MVGSDQVMPHSVRSSQDRSGLVRLCHVRLGHFRSGQAWTSQGEVMSDHVKVKTSQGMSGQVRTNSGQARSDHVRTGQTMSCHEKVR